MSLKKNHFPTSRSGEKKLTMLAKEPLAYFRFLVNPTNFFAFQNGKQKAQHRQSVNIARTLSYRVRHTSGTFPFSSTTGWRPGAPTSPRLVNVFQGLIPTSVSSEPERGSPPHTGGGGKGNFCSTNSGASWR